MTTIPDRAESLNNPVRSTVMELTVTSPSFAAVSLTLVNGTLAAFSGAKEFAGCVPGSTLNPVPTEGIPVGVGVGVGIGPPAVNATYLARDLAPKYPATGATPLAACHAATADFVFAPK